jgi:excisionase family DNA binding protein
MKTPAAVPPNPKPEAPGRPILPKKFDNKAVFDVADVAEIFGMNPWVIYDLVKKKQVRAVKIGRLVKIPRHVVEEMLTA